MALVRRSIHIVAWIGTSVVAIVALGCERILKTLEEIRDSSVTRIRINDTKVDVRQPVSVQPVL